MISVFELDELKNVLEDFYRITNIRITIFDAEQNEIISYPENRSPFCAIVRSCAAGRDACVRCDCEACATATKKKHTHIYRCHAGLTEAITPLYVGNVLTGYLLFGHAYVYPTQEEGVRTIESLCHTYPIDMKQLLAACDACPHVDKDYIRSAARILHATASYLVMEKLASLREDSVAAKLDAYLSAHFTEPITADTLCHTLDIGRSRLYKLSNQLYGCGISQYIRHMRVEKAKQLLRDVPNMRIVDVATECGFGDYNYFIAVFSRMVGEPPYTYKKNLGTVSQKNTL